jgi:polyketide cyclase/dehydrase/lipid transport protein
MGRDVARTWGSTAAERALPFPCDRHLGDPDAAYFRAVDVDAAPSVVFRWLCQLRAAPYSYDWIDNLGRRSPRELTPGLERLEVGQTVMTIFELVEFEPDRHITAVTRRAQRLFGEVAATYLVVPQPGTDGSRLVVKLRVRYPPNPFGRLLIRPLLPWGDLVMMRRQLLNLKRLAEADQPDA